MGRLERSAEANVAFMFDLSKYETQFACPESTPYFVCIEVNHCIQIKVSCRQSSHEAGMRGQLKGRQADMYFIQRQVG